MTFKSFLGIVPPRELFTPIMPKLSTKEHDEGNTKTPRKVAKPQGVVAAMWKAFKKHGYIKRRATKSRTLSDKDALFYYSK